MNSSRKKQLIILITTIFFFHEFELKKTINNINKNNFVRREFEIKKKIENDDENADNNFIISFNRTRRFNISNFNRFRIELKYSKNQHVIKKTI